MPQLDRPNLENLRKRAKTLVRQHRDRYYPVAAKLRLAMSRFATLSDEMVLDASFTLADAQRVVAREAGYADWAQATKELRNMPTNKKAQSELPAPRLRIAFPQLLVADVQRAADFYVEKLGFSIAYLYGEPPFYGLVTRDGVGLNLRSVPSLLFDQTVRERESVLSANIVVENVKALFLELQGRGVDFAQQLKEQPWGATDFIVRDLAGNLLCFANPVDNTAAE
jgi:uncharacterized glyoxalase superfamily protein PhnB